MAQKTFHIELRVINVDDPEKIKAVEEALRTAGSILHAKTLLIVGDGTPPKILIYGEDFRSGKQVINLE